jgi:hypothetical protein
MRILLVSREEIHQRKSLNRENMNSINLHNIYAVSPIYNQWTWLLNNTNEDQPNMTVSNISKDSELRGFQLHTYERMDENILQEIFIIFQSNLPDQIERWYQLLSKRIYECMNNFCFFKEIFSFHFNEFIQINHHVMYLLFVIHMLVQDIIDMFII